MSLLMSRSLSRAPPPAPHCRRPRPASGCPVGARCGVRRPALRPRRSVEAVSARARARRPGSCAQPYEAQLGGLGGLCGGGRPKLAQAKIAGDHPIVPTARRKSGTSPRRDPASGDVASAFPASRRSYKSTRRRGPESGSVVLARPPSTSSIRRRWPPPAIVSAGSGVCAVAHGPGCSSRVPRNADKKTQSPQPNLPDVTLKSHSKKVMADKNAIKELKIPTNAVARRAGQPGCSACIIS